MGKRKRKRNNSRFELLPEEIIHRILSFLPLEKAAQTSVLSKKCLHAWSTYPNLEFDQALFYQRLQARSDRQISEQSKKNKFVKFVDYNLARYIKNNILPIKSFALSIEVFTSRWAPLVDKWLGTALDIGVKELSLTLMPRFLNGHKYRLPQKIFSAKQLTSLSVLGPLWYSSKVISISLEENQAPLGNLKSLHLSVVHLDEQTFRKLCSSCRLIEELSLDGLLKMNPIEVCHLPNLKKLRVVLRPGQKVLINDTPCLEIVTSIGRPCHERAPSISALQFLKILELSSSTITDAELGNLISGCPLLDRLNLDKCNSLKRVNITNQTLKSLTLDRCKGLAEATIDAPNLLFFRYTGNRIPSVSLISSLSERFKSVIDLFLSGDLDTSSFIRISGLLANLRNCVEFRVNISSENICFNVEDLKDIPLLHDQPKVKSLMIRTCLSSKRYKALVDCLQWSCHPETQETGKFRHSEARTYQGRRVVAHQL